MLLLVPVIGVTGNKFVKSQAVLDTELFEVTLQGRTVDLAGRSPDSRHMMGILARLGHVVDLAVRIENVGDVPIVLDREFQERIELHLLEGWTAIPEVESETGYQDILQGEVERRSLKSAVVHIQLQPDASLAPGSGLEIPATATFGAEGAFLAFAYVAPVSVSPNGSCSRGNGRRSIEKFVFVTDNPTATEDAEELVRMANPFINRDNDRAVELLRQAVALNPNLPQALTDYGFVLSQLGRIQEARAVLGRAREAWRIHGLGYSSRDESLAWLNSAMESLEAGHPVLLSY